MIVGEMDRRALNADKLFFNWNKHRYDTENGAVYCVLEFLV